MLFRSYIRTLLLWSSALSIGACSVNLIQGDKIADTEPTQTGKPLFKKISFSLGNDTLWLSQELLEAYNRAAPNDLYPRDKCDGSANIQAQVMQNAPANPWSIPLLVIPIWPITPIDETWIYLLKVQISCDGVLVKQAEYREEETIRAQWYGKLRSDLLNNASRDMHRKLVQRLAFELNYPYNADMGTRSDY